MSIEAAYDTIPEPEDRESYRIGDKGNELAEAEWGLKKLAHYRKLQNDVRRAALAETERIKAWAAGEVQRYENDAQYFETLLVSWHQTRMATAFDEAGGDWAKVKGKSARLPSGQVRARQLPDRVEIADEDVFIRWANGSEHDEMVQVTETPVKRTILASVKETGEVPPGVTFITGDVSFTVVLGSDAEKTDYGDD